MSEKISTQDFITKSINKFGIYYDYSKVDYKGCNVKVCIICPIHGEFWQTPTCHLLTKYGCYKSHLIKPILKEKYCRVCKETKNISEFEQHRYICKKCRNLQVYETLKKNPERLNRQLKNAKNKRLQNPEFYKEYQKNRIVKIKETNIEHLRKISAKAQRNYRRKHKEKHNTYQRKLYKNNINYKIGKLIRQRLRGAIKNETKNLSSLCLLGCSIDHLKIHLQQTAIKNGYLDFDINKYCGNDYHIDHIIPCAAFNLKCEFHQKLCFNWENLQILKAQENMIKGDTI